MRIPYRTRRFFRQLGVALLVLLMIAVVIWLWWVVWLERYVVYSAEGAKLDFSLSAQELEGVLAVKPPEEESVPIYYNEGSAAVDTSKELAPLRGYYVDGSTLAAGVDMVRQQIASLPADTPIVLDVKNIKGSFYYSTKVGSTSSAVDIAEVDRLISDLAGSQHYVIAKLPGLRDWEFGLNNVSYGLFIPSGMGLWMDDDGCYWLDPTSTGTMNYLTRITLELRELGFDEVVFSDFCFPQSSGYVFSGDRYEALSNAAAKLVSSCGTDSFAISFMSTDLDFPLPEGRTRLFLQGISAVDVRSIVSNIQVADPEIRVVFYVDSNDTRYDTFSVIRPLANAH